MKNICSDNVPVLSPGEPHDAAQAGLTEWYRIVGSGDWDAFYNLLSDDVVLHSPESIDTESNNDKVNMAAMLEARFSVVKNFRYLRHFGSGSGYAIEFNGVVGDDPIFGVDLMTFSPDGKLISLMVIMRPAKMIMNLSSGAGRHNQTH